MNKWITISIIVALLAGVGVTGVLYAQETGKLKDAQDEIAGLEGNVSTLQTELSDSETTVSNLEGNVSTLETELVASEAEVTRLDGELVASEAEVTRLDGELTAAESEVTRLDGELVASEAEVTRLDGELTVAESEVTRLDRELTAAEAQVSTLGTDLAAAEAEVSALEATLAAQVSIPGFRFYPATITVPVGTTVTWTHLDSIGHTVTSDTGLFDSGGLDFGDTFSYTFTESGIFNYHCTPHPWMRGTVIVE